MQHLKAHVRPRTLASTTTCKREILESTCDSNTGPRWGHPERLIARAVLARVLSALERDQFANDDNVAATKVHVRRRDGDANVEEVRAFELVNRDHRVIADDRTGRNGGHQRASLDWRVERGCYDRTSGLGSSMLYHCS